MINVSVSLYPQETEESDQIINNSIKKLKEKVSGITVGPVDTEFSAEPEVVWDALKAMYEEAESTGNEVSMEVTFTNSQV